MKMLMTPKIQAMGCVSTLISLGGLISGIYCGISNAKGIPLDPTTTNLLEYSPAAVNGLVGLIGGVTATKDPEIMENFMENYIEKIPPGMRMDKESFEGCSKGCLPVGSTITNMAITGTLTYVGYLIGNWLGSQF